MTELQKKFIEETGASFDGIPINGLHLEYITWLEAKIQALRIHDVSGRSEQLLDFLIHLNDKKLINNHDFDYEKEAQKYIKKQSITIKTKNK